MVSEISVQDQLDPLLWASVRQNVMGEEASGRFCSYRGNQEAEERQEEARDRA
jgi:hypothetical protein